jgi:hypothetical protein
MSSIWTKFEKQILKWSRITFLSDAQSKNWKVQHVCGPVVQLYNNFTT